MVDSLKIYEILVAGRVPEEQARTIAAAMQAAETEVISEMGVVFRRELRREAEALRLDAETRVNRLEGSIIQRMRLERTQAEVAALERWMYVLWFGQWAVTVGLVLASLRLKR